MSQHLYIDDKVEKRGDTYRRIYTSFTNLKMRLPNPLIYLMVSPIAIVSKISVHLFHQQTVHCVQGGGTFWRVF